ncbi:hypothetical protein Hanom_Chr17g01565681 [Helianthus anomalus]
MTSSKNDIMFIFHDLHKLMSISFCLDYDIDPLLGVVAPGDRTANKCQSTKPTLRFYTLFLDALKYYLLSLGQLAPVGVARVFHFEILCRALSYEPSLIMFRCCFCLVRNGDWFTIEKRQCEAALITVTTGYTYAWKDRFFFIYENLLPFVTVVAILLMVYVRKLLCN